MIDSISCAIYLTIQGTAEFNLCEFTDDVALTQLETLLVQVTKLNFLLLEFLSR